MNSRFFLCNIFYVKEKKIVPLKHRLHQLIFIINLMVHNKSALILFLVVIVETCSVASYRLDIFVIETTSFLTSRRFKEKLLEKKRAGSCFFMFLFQLPTSVTHLNSINCNVLYASLVTFP